MKIIYFLFFLSINFSPNFSIAQNGISGTVADEEDKQAIRYGTVTLYKNGIFVCETATDKNGYYSFPSLEPGTYEIQAGSVGYPSRLITSIYVKNDVVRRIDFYLRFVVCSEYIIGSYQIPLIELENLTSGHTYFDNEIRRSPIAKSN